MARPCRQYRCANLVTSPAQRGFCDDHASQRSGWSRRPDRSGSTTSRGYGWTWQKLRERILKRDGWICAQCKRAGRIVNATDVDHIVSKAKGGTDEPDNLQALCSVCHKAKTATEAGVG